MESDFIGRTLTNNIIIVDKIFRNLNARQLNTCSRVCKVWRDEAKREKERRQYLNWNCFQAESASSIEGDNKSWWQSVANFLLFFSYSTLLQLPSITATTIILCSFPGQGALKSLTGTDANMKTLELDREEYGKALSLIMFGEISGVNFVPFSLTHEECDSLKGYLAKDNDPIPQYIQPLLNKEIKMINIYLPRNDTDRDRDVKVNLSLSRICNYPLVTGGYVNEQHVKDSHGNFFSSALDRSCVMSGLAICGANVKVASVMIQSIDIAEVDRIIQALREHKFPLHRSFGLMYSCVGRGSHVYGKQNVESSIFRKYFPTTPLLGFFANVEDVKFNPPVLVGVEELQSTIQSTETNISSLGNRRALILDMELMRRLEEKRQEPEAYKMKDKPTFILAYATVMYLVSLP